MAPRTLTARAWRFGAALLVAMAASAGCTSLAGLNGGGEAPPSAADGSGNDDASATLNDATPDADAGSTDADADASVSLGQLACGQSHCCFRKVDGTVACWGGNGSGQLGDGTQVDSPLPKKVMNLTDAVAIATGFSHTCAVRAITGNNLVCWGSGSSGELGSGGGQSSVPVVAIVSDVTHVAAGALVTCAGHAGGTAHCWGYNYHSNIGSGAPGIVPTPTLVPGLADITAMSIGNATCALRQGGAVSCWGYNNYGSVGNGATLPAADVPGPTGVVGLADATRMSSGLFHTCVLRTGGGVSCWGMGTFGQLGLGADTSDHSTPASAPVSNVVAIATGGYETCALKSTGGVSCWGNGNDGEIGNGSAQAALVPNDVVGLTDAVQIAVGGTSACALRKTGDILCWGGNSNGSLGNGGDAGSLTPTPVTGL